MKSRTLYFDPSGRGAELLANETHQAQNLLLINCGIEVILEKAFDLIGETLEELSLDLNRLTVINFDDFHQKISTYNPQSARM